MHKRAKFPIRPIQSRIWLAFGLLVAFAFPSTGEELVPLSPQPEGLAWPTNEWPQAELPDDLDRAAFETHVEKLFAEKGRGGYSDTRAIIIVQAGRIVYERYADGFGKESLFQSWSMAKSMTNALTGILVRQGRLAIDNQAPVAEWQGSNDPRRELTLRHLLQMRSGLGNGDGFGSGDMIRAFVTRLLFGEGSRAPGAYAANVGLEHPIGEHWAYSSGTSILVARICGEEIGGGAPGTRDFFRRELLGPIGMKSAQPEFAKTGEFMGGAFFHATARDWARFGYLYLRDGIWDGQQILPEGWVGFSRTASPAENNRVYGAHFWLNHDPPEGHQWKPLPGGPASLFIAEGAEFQMVAISPSQDVVAVRLGIAQGTGYPEVKEPFGPLISAFGDRP